MRRIIFFFFFSSRRRHTRFKCDWSSDVCSSDLPKASPQPTNCTRISCCRFWLAAARRAEQPRQQPDRDHDHCAEQEVAPQPVHGVEAEIPEALKQELDAADDVVG